MMPEVDIEKNVLNYIEERGIKYAAVCRETGLSKDLFDSVKRKGRKFRADEFTKVCIFLKEDPKKFMGMEE